MAEQWDSSLYDDRHSFVWKTSADLIDLLDPKPGERVLDLGCGTGHLTSQIAERGVEVIGMDASLSMVAQARQNYPKLKFMVGDATGFRSDQPYDAVFSNAALHWMLQPEPVIESVAGALKPGGRFVLEMGVHGNIAAILRTLGEVVPNGRDPWYFPTGAQYATLLEKQGFEIRALFTFERWHKLEHPERGMREWLEMFAGTWFEGVSPEDTARAVSEIEKQLRPQLYCDGNWWADYKRLRVVARLNAARLNTASR
jgi:trans-aconitate methyltransferase